MPVAVVKLGSSIVAEDSGELRLSVVARIIEEVAALHREGVEAVVVTSGAIARGMHLLAMGARPAAVEDLQAASAVGQGRLYRTYDELLRERGIQTAQVLLTFFDMSARTHYLNARRTLQKLLEWRIVPVINENDTTTTDEISFGDNDFLAAQVAVLVDASLLLLLTSTAGVYTASPRRDPSSSLVSGGADPSALEAWDIGARTTALGSGGMRSKVVAAEMATAAGIPTVIGSGFEPGLLARAWAGEPGGTRFAAQAERQPSFKLWLRYAKPSQGAVVVDAGAARALRDGGTSLLPVGIVSVEGAFEAGDAVEGRANAEVVGKGISNYSAVELRQVIGLKSAQVREVLPRATDEAVHRDYFLLTGGAELAGGRGLGEHLRVGRDPRRGERADDQVEQRQAGGHQEPAVIAGRERVGGRGAAGEDGDRARRRGGGDDGEPERPAHLEGGGHDAGGGADILRRHVGHRGDLVAHAHQRQAEAEHHEPGEQVGHVVGLRADLGQQEQAGDADRRAGEEGDPGAEARHELGAERRGHDRGDAHRDEVQAGLERAVV